MVTNPEALTDAEPFEIKPYDIDHHTWVRHPEHPACGWFRATGWWNIDEDLPARKWPLIRKD